MSNAKPFQGRLGFDANNNKIINVAAPTALGDGVNYETMTVPAHSATREYPIGFVVEYNNQVHKAKTALVAKAFNQSDWNVIADGVLRTDLATSNDVAKGAVMVSMTPTTPAAQPTTVYEILSRTINVLDILTPSEKLDVISRAGLVNINAKLQTLLNSAPAYSRIVFGNGAYLNSGAVGLTISKPLTLIFENGAYLKFNHNNATYIQTTASDIVMIDLRIDGGSASWTRTGNAAIRVRSNGVPVSGITIVRPRISNVAGAGILCGWSDEISDITIDNPVVRNTQADGVSITYNTHDVSVIAPRCYNTGDDGISIVSYLSASSPCKRITITDALSVDSHTRGITVIGGEDIKVSGQSINAAAQGSLILQDTGTYNTYPPVRVSVDLRIYNSTGNGVEIGTNAKNISGQLSVVGAKGARGILIGSGIGLEPSKISLDLAASDCVNSGIEVNNAFDVNLGRVNVSNNGLAGLTVASGTKRFSYGSCNAYNNNTKNVAGVDNILINGVVGFSLGATISIDDNTTPNIERTMDITSSSDGIIGSFMGKKNTTLTPPNIQSTCVNVITTGGMGAGQYGSVGTSSVAPTATHLPAGSFLLDTVGSKLYFYTGSVWKSATLA